MKIEIKAYSCLCALEVFTINGIRADYEDFGDKDDTSQETAPDYGCGNMQFIPKLATSEVLSKYGITADEYKKVCDELDVLSYGSCGWCI